MTEQGQGSATYKAAGVDIDLAGDVNKLIGTQCKTTYNKYVISGVGLFCSVFDLGAFLHDKFGIPLSDDSPYLVQSIDGPGTLPMLAKLVHDIGGGTEYYTLAGKNVARHCRCDIGTSGAIAMTGVDNISSTDMAPDIHEAIVTGLAEGFREADCALVGGECAQLNGIIVPGQHDFCASVSGVVLRSRFINPLERVKPGGALVGIASNGLMLNGWSFVRQITLDPVKGLGLKVDDIIDFSGKSVAETFITEQPDFAAIVQALLERGLDIHANCHITGGGLYDNIERVLPCGCQAIINAGIWPTPEVFRWLVEKKNVDQCEAHRTWNMGVGWVMIIDPENVPWVIKVIKDVFGLDAWHIGNIVEGERGVEIKF